MVDCNTACKYGVGSRAVWAVQILYKHTHTFSNAWMCLILPPTGGSSDTVIYMRGSNASATVVTTLAGKPYAELHINNKI